MTVAEKISENAKNSNISKATSFSKGMPPQFDGDSMLQKGDKIVLPAQLGEVFSQKFGNNVAEFIVVELVKVNGTKTAFNFFPSMLSKTIFPAEEVNGQVKLKLPVMHPKGDVVDHYLSFRGKSEDGKNDVQLAMESMLDWTIEVTDDLTVKTQKWADGKALNELRDTHVFTYTKA
jgi:hypothetical protein